MPDDVVSKDEIVDALSDDRDILQQQLDLANKAADYWREIALEHKDSGEYIDSISVERDGDVIYILCDSPIAHILEFGSIDTPEFGFRARTENHFNNGGD